MAAERDVAVLLDSREWWSSYMSYDIWVQRECCLLQIAVMYKVFMKDSSAHHIKMTIKLLSDMPALLFYYFEGNQVFSASCLNGCIEHISAKVTNAIILNLVPIMFKVLLKCM